MGVWYKLQEWFKKFHRKKDLREVCRDKYGDDFVEMYDMVSSGIPIGNLEETLIFLAMVKAEEEGKKMNDDVIWCEDCQHFENPGMGGEGDCSVWGLHTWYGRSIGYCPYFKRKKKKEGDE